MSAAEPSLEPLDASPDVSGERIDLATRRSALIWMPFWFLLAGLGTALFGEGDLIDVILQAAASLAFLVLLHKWCGADARLHGTTLWPYFVLTLVLCPGPFLVVPVHLIKTRGVNGVLSIVLAVGWFIVLVIAEALGIAIGLVVTGRI